jgi:hypothetical protein
LQTRFLMWFGKPTSTPQVLTVLEYCTLLLIQVKYTMLLINSHWEIIPLEVFSLGDNTSLMPGVYPNSQMFTIIICLQQDSLSLKVDCTIKNYNLYNSLDSTQDDWKCVNIMSMRYYTHVLEYKDLI